MNRTLALTLLILTAGTAAVASAQAPAARSWESLSEADRAALIEPTRERWERATPEQQVRGGELSQHGSLTALPRVETTGKQEVERFLLAS